MKHYFLAWGENYRVTLLLAVLFHILLFTLLFVTLTHSVKPLFLRAAPITIIQATAVESNQLAIQDINKQKKTELPVKVEKVPLKPVIVEKSPLTLPLREKKLAKKSLNPSPMVVKSPLPKSASKQHVVPSQKLVQATRGTKEKNRKATLSAKTLAITQKNVQQLLQQEVTSTEKRTETALRNTATTEKYRHLILQAIAQQWIIPPDLDKNLETKLVVRLAPGGMVLDVMIVKSSGNTVLDRSAQTAVYKASPLPVPKQTVLFNTFEKINLTVRPKGILNAS